MESCLNNTESFYRDIEEYKTDINEIIKDMIYKKERLVFAIVAEKSGVTRFVIRRHPELRNYILQKMVYYKELHVIDQKIDRAVNSLIKSNISLTFMSIASKCKFSSDDIYRNRYIKNKIINIIANNLKDRTVRNKN
ncbi:hypothetical protein I6U48_15995 [Clostridium sp. PL3]|uniref:Uncharacterized protein n=1 Tax=Clostridium thailandense TaxID=2794346 RepID=A0A949X3D9_9CLOT|nr:hypothetical protein [Clostridium thailandense]MBV7274399.1 hypothetical protein [Clostridium thailandense]